MIYCKGKVHIFFILNEFENCPYLLKRAPVSPPMEHRGKHADNVSSWQNTKPSRIQLICLIFLLKVGLLKV